MVKSKRFNLAQIIYQAYPHSDLLPIDPQRDCRSLATLQAKVIQYDIGDSLFRFIVIECVEGGEGTHKGAIRVLVQATRDLAAVLKALGYKKSDDLRKWQCPDCSRRVVCSYEELAQAGSPYCADCDCEMVML